MSARSSPSLDQFLTVVTQRWRQGRARSTSGGVVGCPTTIDKKPEGIYAVVDLTAEPATVKELDRQLNLNEGVLRTKVLRPDVH